MAKNAPRNAHRLHAYTWAPRGECDKPYEDLV